jgi:hypothetical protein
MVNSGDIMKLAIVLAVACALIAACGGVDKQKFDGVSKAGKALQEEVQSSGGLPRSQSRDRLKALDAEVAALQDRTVGTREANALQAYTEAADAYRAFLHFRGLDVDHGQILLKGTSIEMATRYKLPIDTRNGSKSVSSAQALTILLQAAEQHVNDGNRLVNGR